MATNKKPDLSGVRDSETVPFLHKLVPFRFRGENMELYLSHALFSSFAIDDGSRLLLKTAAQRNLLAEGMRVLDMGCGVGTLGIALQKGFPGTHITFTDRDALALRVAAVNCRRNRITGAAFRGQLGVFREDAALWDRIVSNIPAKVGTPVLRSLFAAMLHSLAPNGMAAVVVIDALCEDVDAILKDLNVEIFHREGNRRYTVLHFGPGKTAVPPGETGLDPEGWGAPYVRGEYPFRFGDRTYEARTVWNLPEFDTLGYHTRLLMRILKGRKRFGRSLFWNPGQGHLPAAFAAETKDAETVLAGRDLLQLKCSQTNLAHAGGHSSIVHSAFYRDVDGMFDTVVLLPDVVPDTPWERMITENLVPKIKPGGILAIGGKSVYLSRVLERNSALTSVARQKNRGFSAVVLRQP